MTSSTPQWPALIRHHGNAELEYIPDAVAFRAWQPATLTPATLIDVIGQAFELSARKHLLPTTKLPLEEMLELIRAHAALEGICCTTKLGASNIPSAMALLAGLVKD